MGPRIRYLSDFSERVNRVFHDWRSVAQVRRESRFFLLQLDIDSAHLELMGDVAVDGLGPRWRLMRSSFESAKYWSNRATSRK
jgi:hypothetical protein